MALGTMHGLVWRGTVGHRADLVSVGCGTVLMVPVSVGDYTPIMPVPYWSEAVTWFENERLPWAAEKSGPWPEGLCLVHTYADGVRCDYSTPVSYVDEAGLGGPTGCSGWRPVGEWCAGALSFECCSKAGIRSTRDRLGLLPWGCGLPIRLCRPRGVGRMGLLMRLS